MHNNSPTDALIGSIAVGLKIEFILILINIKIYIMKGLQSRLSLIVLLSFVVTFFSSCEVIGGIFKAGVWVGVVVIVAVIALILFLVGKAKK